MICGAAQRLLACDLALTMQSDAMNPVIEFGSMIYCQRVRNLNEVSHDNGGLYVVQTKHNIVTVGETYFDGLRPREKDGVPHLEIMYKNPLLSGSMFLLSEIKDVWRVVLIEPKDDFMPVWKVSA